MKNTFLIFAVLFIMSCSNDSNEDIKVEAEIQSFFNLFESEAEIRGVDVDLAALDLSAYVEFIRENGVVGQCKSYSDGSNTIVLDNQYWNRATELEKEYLVFHELGHCVLERSHNNQQNQLGNCISIMQSGENACNGVYTEFNREELINELFEEE